MPDSRAILRSALLLAGLALMPSGAEAQAYLAIHVSFLGQPFDGYHASTSVDMLFDATNPADPPVEFDNYNLGWAQGADYGLLDFGGNGGFTIKNVHTYDPVTNCVLDGGGAQGVLAFNDTVHVGQTVTWSYCAVSFRPLSTGGASGEVRITGPNADRSFDARVDSTGGVTYTQIGAHAGAIPHGSPVTLTFFADPGFIVSVLGRTSAPGGVIVVDTVANNSFAPTASFSRATTFTVTLGGHNPSGGTVAKGSSHVPMLEFRLNPAAPESVTSVTVHGSGSGNEQVDVTQVGLYNDLNGNGRVDTGEPLLASGTFPANDGTVTLTLAPPLSISAPTDLLVTYNFNTSIAARLGSAVALAILPLFFVPVVRRRKGLMLGMLAFILTAGVTSCSGGSGPTEPGGGSSTYQATLTGVTVSGTPQTGLTLSGGTVTVDK